MFRSIYCSRVSFSSCLGSLPITCVIQILTNSFLSPSSTQGDAAQFPRPNIRIRKLKEWHAHFLFLSLFLSASLSHSFSLSSLCPYPWQLFSYGQCLIGSPSFLEGMSSFLLLFLMTKKDLARVSCVARDKQAEQP